MKPFSTIAVAAAISYSPGVNLTMPKLTNNNPNIITTTLTNPPWLGRSIATRKLRMIEHSAFVEDRSEREGSGDTYQKHLFVHIGERAEYTDPSLEVRFDIFTFN